MRASLTLSFLKRCFSCPAVVWDVSRRGIAITIRPFYHMFHIVNAADSKWTSFCMFCSGRRAQTHLDKFPPLDNVGERDL